MLTLGKAKRWSCRRSRPTRKYRRDRPDGGPGRGDGAVRHGPPPLPAGEERRRHRRGVAVRGRVPGAGEKITLSVFSPTSGFETGKVEADGDGQPDAACDLSPDSGTFAIGHRGTGKVTVWDVRKKAKKLGRLRAVQATSRSTRRRSWRRAPDRSRRTGWSRSRPRGPSTCGTWRRRPRPASTPPRAAVGKAAGRAPRLANRQGVVVAVGGAVYSVNAGRGCGRRRGRGPRRRRGEVARTRGVAVGAGGVRVRDGRGRKRERAVGHLSDGKLGSVFRLAGGHGRADGRELVRRPVGDGDVRNGGGGGIRRRRGGAVPASGGRRAAGDKAAVAAADGGL